MNSDRDLEDYEHIDEERIRARAKETKSKAMMRLLAVAEEWRAAGCTPVYIIVQEEPTIVACVSKETFGKDPN